MVKPKFIQLKDAITGEPVYPITARLDEIVPIQQGGTGAVTVQEVRENLNVFSKEEVNDLLDNIDISELDLHIANKSNPHELTLSQLGVNISANEINGISNTITDLQTQIDTKVSQNRTINGKTLVDDIILTAEDVGVDLSEAITEHNTSITTHNDIRIIISELNNRLNALANSDDNTLDQMNEVVEYIKANRDLIESVTTSKINVSDIIDNLTTNIAGKPLSAAQGVVLKSLIDALDNSIKGHIADEIAHVTSTEKSLWNTISNKIDKVSNKGLSTNDFTDTLFTKLTNIEDSANNYVHPNSGVAAGTYRSVTVDTAGHVTAGTNPTTLAGYGIVDAEVKGTSSSIVATHNTATDTHADLRDMIADLSAEIDKMKNVSFAALSAYPVGSIYLSINNINPSDLFGGEWTAWGTGRVPVGVDTSNLNFSTPESIGGASTHKLTTTEMPSHSHTVTSTAESGGAHGHTFSSGTTNSTGSHAHTITSSSASAGAHTHTTSGTAASAGAHTHGINNCSAAGSSGAQLESYAKGDSKNRSVSTKSAGAHTHSVSGTAASAGSHSHTITSTAASNGSHSHTVTGTVASNGSHTHTITNTVTNSGSGGEHNNLQPYITCYMWKRIA